jgi:hypothetical protein
LALFCVILQGYLTVEKFKICSLFKNGEMQGSEKIQGAQSCADARSGFFR